MCKLQTITQKNRIMQGIMTPPTKIINPTLVYSDKSKLESQTKNSGKKIYGDRCKENM